MSIHLNYLHNVSGHESNVLTYSPSKFQLLHFFLKLLTTSPTILLFLPFSLRNLEKIEKYFTRLYHRSPTTIWDLLFVVLSKGKISQRKKKDMPQKAKLGGLSHPRPLTLDMELQDLIFSLLCSSFALVQYPITMWRYSSLLVIYILYHCMLEVCN